ncbi:MAG: hypothetical protein HY764_02555 [Candidatus Portnoybacteria bacterium]|nr:hypothetical protein [Candidatus Portnoybacteria bacterium]
MRRFEQPREFYSGHDYERDVIGEVDIDDPRYKAELARLRAKAEKEGYELRDKNFLPLPYARELVKKFQPWDPTNPGKEFLKELRLAMAEKLGLEDEKDMDRLKIFTGARTPLDIFYKTDFYVSLEPGKKGQKEQIVTFDLTKDPEKSKTETKADICVEDIVPDPSDPDFDERIIKISESYARRALDVIQRKEGSA